MSSVPTVWDLKPKKKTNKKITTTLFDINNNDNNNNSKNNRQKPYNRTPKYKPMKYTNSNLNHADEIRTFGFISL